AGKRKCAVGQGKNETTVTGLVAVEHVGAHRHAHICRTRCHAVQAQAQALRRLVIPIHMLADLLGQRLWVFNSKCVALHYFALNWGARLPRNALTPSRLSSDAPSSRIKSRSRSNC